MGWLNVDEILLAYAKSYTADDNRVKSKAIWRLCFYKPENISAEDRDHLEINLINLR